MPTIGSVNVPSRSNKRYCFNIFPLPSSLLPVSNYKRKPPLFQWQFSPEFSLSCVFADISLFFFVTRPPILPLSFAVRHRQHRRLPCPPAPAPSQSRISSDPPALSAPDPPVLFFFFDTGSRSFHMESIPAVQYFHTDRFLLRSHYLFAYPFSPWNTTIFSALFPFSRSRSDLGSFCKVFLGDNISCQIWKSLVSAVIM